MGYLCEDILFSFMLLSLNLSNRRHINLSYTKPFGTHTFYQRGGSGQTPCYLKNYRSHEPQIL